MKTAGFAGAAVGFAFALGAGCDPAKVQRQGTTPERTDAGSTPAPGPGKDGGASAPDASGTVPTGDAGGGANPGSDAGKPAAFTERPCNFRPMPARPVRCGVVTVPEARGGASTRTVELAVVIIKSASPTPAPDPLVFLQGGPGGGGVEFIVALAGGMGGPMDAVLAKRDVISIDQRGTGRSRPLLDCPEVNQAAMNPVPPAMMMMNGVAEALGRCRARLAGMGIDLDQYQTNAAADDVEDVRRALGLSQWNLLGGSYGTRLALEVARRHASGIRTLLLDSVSPPDVDLIGESGQNSIRVLESAWAICAAQPACNQAYPQLGTVFTRTVARLNMQPARLLGGLLPVDGDTYMQLVLFMMRSPMLMPGLPELVYQASEQNYAQLQAQLLQLAQASMGGAGGAIAMGLHLSVMCADYLPFTTRAMIESKAAAIAPELRRAVLRTGLGYIDNCQAWNVQPSSPAVYQAVTSQLPSLVLAGSMDPATPPRWAQQAAKTLPAAHYIELKGVGHGVFPTPCGSALLPPFLDAPAQKPAPACLGTLQDVQFRVQR
jgi:pimeloyl-ACP methyl ester carboxylesterase